MGDKHGWRYTVGLLGFTAVYFLLDQIGLFLQGAYGGLTPLWPASGLALALLWRGGLRWWPVVAIGEAAIAVWLGQPPVMWVVGPLAQLSEALLGLWLLNRYQIHPGLRQVRDVLAFALAVCLLAPVPAALLGTSAMFAGDMLGARELLPAALTWWLGDALGLLIVTPLLVIWRRWSFRSRFEALNWAGVLVLWAVLGTALVLVNGHAGDYLFFLLLPAVIWLSLRYGRVGAASAAVFLALVVFGLNAQRGVPDGFLTGVRIAFVGVSAMIGYLLAAMHSEQRRLVAQLEQRASHDSLTGLLDRGAFHRRLERLLAEGEGESHALLYLDLDQFKIVNDTCGHAAGDRMLAELANLLEASAEPSYIFGRLGGDEFAVLMPWASEAEALYTAEVLRRAILDFRYSYGELVFSVGVSIGITLIQSHDTPEGVMTRADIACYSAKREGRNRVHLYRIDDLEMRRQHSELRWISQMHQAMQDGRLQLYVQRIMAVRGEAPPLFEVLLRYVEGGRVATPGAFLPVAARYGLMPELDHWVVDQALRALSAAADDQLSLSINLSGTTLDSPRFVDDMLALADRYRIAPARVCLEITESVAIDRLTRAQRQMRWLQDVGFRFALDDFGSGVASFGYLEALPVDMVKIDGRFVKGLENDTANLIIVEALLNLAKARGITCVAEWVETDRQMARLAALGIDYVQGFHVHRPERLTNILSQSGNWLVSGVNSTQGFA